MDIIGGGTPKTSKMEYWNGTIPWLSVKDFNNDFRYVYETEKTITELGLQNSSTKLLKKDDIIISARGTVGELAMIPFPMAFNQSCYGLRAKEDVLDATFLYYLVKHNIALLKKNTHGSVFDTITRDTFNGIEVEIPCKEHQIKIASILSCMDDKIELNNKINANLQQQAEAIFKSWFVDFEPFQNGEFVESELGLIPKGWVVGKLGNVMKISSGKRPQNKQLNQSEEYSIPIIGASGVMAYTNVALTEEKVLVTGRVGTHGVIQKYEMPIWISDNAFQIIATYYEFVYQHLLKIDYSSLNRGSTQPLITQTDLKNMPIVLPPKVVLDKFEYLMTTYSSMERKNYMENIWLSQIRDCLLPKLMNSEITL